MKASQLVAELQRHIAEHGDIEVLVYNPNSLEEREPQLRLVEAKWRQSYWEPVAVLALN